jgi:RNA polymerase sigma factor (sigma-70 family)
LSTTPISLLERLRLGADSASWQRLVDLYAPFVSTWLRSQGVQLADVDDLMQEVLETLVRELPHFRHDLRPGAFRRWLRGIALNRLRAFRRVRRPLPAGGNSSLEEALDQLEDPDSDLSRRWDEEHDRHVIRRLLELIEPEFEPATWRAFHRLVLDGRSTAEVAAELGLSANAVRSNSSKSRGISIGALSGAQHHRAGRRQPPVWLICWPCPPGFFQTGTDATGMAVVSAARARITSASRDT